MVFQYKAFQITFLMASYSEAYCVSYSVETSFSYVSKALLIKVALISCHFYGRYLGVPFLTGRRTLVTLLDI